MHIFIQKFSHLDKLTEFDSESDVMAINGLSLSFSLSSKPLNMRTYKRNINVLKFDCVE